MNYENLEFFDKDFPNATSVRTCQKGAYNCAVQKLHLENKLSMSVFLPTGTGKSDVIRSISIGLCEKRNVFCGAWVFSPSNELREQIAKDDVDKFFQRIGDNRSINPFMTENSLDAERFRNNSLMESYTIQFLITNGNCNRFLEHAKRLKKITGKMPIAIFDESHLCSTDNTWGEQAIKMYNAGIPIILVTGSPYRSDDAGIPGFKLELLEINEKSFCKNTKISSTEIKISLGQEKQTKYKLKADYEYSYQRAWKDKVILEPDPIFVDAEVVNIVYNKLLSEIGISNSNKLLRHFLTNPKTVEETVKVAIEKIRLRKIADNKSAAIIATLSDLDTDEQGNDIMADLHANQIHREFERLAPDLKIMVVTSNTNPNGLKEFKNSDYDVLIVKAMGTIGFNCPRIKTVVNLSNYRTLPATIQLFMRGCRNFANIANFDVIMPKDKGMINLWEQFKTETGLIITQKEIISETSEVIPLEEKEQKEKLENTYTNFQVNTDPKIGRNEQDEIIEFVDKTFPQTANTLNNQNKLIFFNELKGIIGEKIWEEKPKNSSVKSLPLLDLNKEEARLRTQANDMVKLINNEIRLLMKQKYSPELFGEINKYVWSYIKHKCGFSPNQSLNKLTGVSNFQKIVSAAEFLKSKIGITPENPNFDFKTFLKDIK